MNIFKKKIILASQSPRRQQLLQQAGFQFEVKVNPINEDFPDDMPADEVASFLAHNKAQAASHFLDEDNILLTADSVVIVGDKILNKPADAAEATAMLRQLSDRMHRVITGVCLLSEKHERVFSEEAKVYFDPLSAEEIEYYVNEYEPYDKAGGYAIQEWIGLCKINKIEGTYSNIMGLPMQRVYQELLRF